MTVVVAEGPQVETLPVSTSRPPVMMLVEAVDSVVDGELVMITEVDVFGAVTVGATLEELEELDEVFDTLTTVLVGEELDEAIETAGAPKAFAAVFLYKLMAQDPPQISVVLPPQEKVHPTLVLLKASPVLQKHCSPFSTPKRR